MITHTSSYKMNIIVTIIIIMLSNIHNYHLQPMNGTQFYLELLDRDSGGKNDLIDRFAINISVPVNSFIERANYSGIFGMAMLEVSFYVISNSSTTESSPTVVTSTESGPTAVISPTVAISTESGPMVVISTDSSNIGVILGSFGGVILLILLIIVLSMVVCIVMITRKRKSQSSLPVNVLSSNELTLMSYSEKGLDINKEDDTTEQKHNMRYVESGTIINESQMESKQVKENDSIEHELKDDEYETMESNVLYMYGIDGK